MSWQRVESSAVDPDLDDGLAARIADPLWLLARQWQVGEFQGEDAANPFFVEVTAASADLDQVRLGDRGGATTTIDPQVLDVPLEVAVEAERLDRGPGATRLASDVGHLVAAAIRGLRGIDRDQAEQLIGRLRARFPLDEPASGDGGDDRAGERRLAVLRRHGVDGLAVVRDVRAGGRVLGEVVAEARGAPSAEQVRAAVAAIPDAFSEPLGGGSWNPSRMEYEVGVAGPAVGGSPVDLVARDHGGGRLDWFSFDRIERPVVGGPAVGEPGVGGSGAKVHQHRAELLPKPLRYAGMPASRFWEIEDAAVCFGGLDAAPEDLARLAFAAYATVAGDDWYVVPLVLPAGRVCTVTEVVVHDDFGGRTTVASAAHVDGPDRAFRFFELTGDGGAGPSTSPLLLLPPTVETTDAGRVLDDVRVVRDEAANLAWAIEQRVESRYGRGVDPTLAGPPTTSGNSDGSTSDGGTWRFTLSGQVPSNWVPLLPVRLGATGAIGLQRGRMPVPGTSTTRGASSAVLEPADRLVIEESEVPSVGLRVVRRFQSARSADGRLHVWLGRQKGPGRGDLESGFVFDQLDTGSSSGS